MATVVSKSCERGEEKKEKRDLALTVESLNPRLLDMKYAVRGKVLDIAQDLKKQLASGAALPFSELCSCNIGNPQKLGQVPLKFNREVLALLMMPSLMLSKDSTMFSDAAKTRAKAYLSEIEGGVGAYSMSQGLLIVRKEVASFITKRDGFPSNPDHIFLTSGASAGVKMIYQALVSGSRKEGIMVPIPQYPLYSALSTLMGAELCGYYLDESSAWTAHLKEMERAYTEATRAHGTSVCAMVVINPGNPTGQCLSEASQRDIVRFCVRHRLVLLADEVYQENVYAKDKRFTSFKRVALAMGNEAADLQLVSFHSISKGFIGECGLRGGYMELHNISDDVIAQFRKLASVSLCPNTIGQVSVGLMVNPPTNDAEYSRQRDATLASLKRRAEKLAGALNDIDGISCNDAEGAMYLFPKIQLPECVSRIAKEKGYASADEYYCAEVVRSTGIVVVPGSGFKQVRGTFHFRTTFLPPEERIDGFVKVFGDFHRSFLRAHESK